MQRVCRLVKQARSTFYYRGIKIRKQRIRKIARIRCVRYGYRRVQVPLKCENWRISRKHVYRLDVEEQLRLRSKLPR